MRSTRPRRTGGQTRFHVHASQEWKGHLSESPGTSTGLMYAQDSIADGGVVGHWLLGNLPQTRPWLRVVELLGLGADASTVAEATLQAAERGLERVRDDEGFVHAVWLLTQLPLAAKTEDFRSALQQLGIDVPSQVTVDDIVTGFMSAVDRHLERKGGRTDLGELAQLAAAEVLTTVGHDLAEDLYEASPERVRQGVAKLNTVSQFGRLGSAFFASFLNRYLVGLLSRELSNHVGPGYRFSSTQECGEFTRALDDHCREAAVIVQRFSGEWFSSKAYRGPITRRTAANFAHGGVSKLRKELAIRARKDG